MNPAILIPVLAFVSVACIIGMLAFVFRQDGPKTATRLDMLIGKGKRKEIVSTRSSVEADPAAHSVARVKPPRWLRPVPQHRSSPESPDCCSRTTLP